MLTIHSACEYEDDERQSTDDGNSSKLMSNMTPEQMLEQSKAAQEKMSR